MLTVKARTNNATLFLTEAPTGQEFVLPEDVQHHLMTVLRGKEGTQAEFVYPDQQTMVVAEVIRVDDETTTMRVVEEVTTDVELPVETTIILGLAKGDKPELVVQKATELGVHHVIIVETDWSVVHWGMKADKKLARLQKIAQGAAEQSHRLRVPDVTYVENYVIWCYLMIWLKLLPGKRALSRAKQHNWWLSLVA